MTIELYGNAVTPMQYATAWLTTDPTRLAGPLADIVILNIDPDSGAVVGGPLGEFVLDVDVTADFEPAAVQDAADAMLSRHGWTLTGPWEQVDSGAVATVQFASPSGQRTEATACTCGTPLGDHCPRCGSCECVITKGKVHRNSECPGQPARMRPLYPFSR